MSEHLPGHEQHEHANHHERPSSAEHHRPKHEAAELNPAEQAEKLAAIHKTIEKEAKSTRELPVERPEDSASERPLLVNRGLKTAAFDRLLAHTRKQLAGPDRLFSKLIHQPAVDTLSNGAEKTIARPTPLLWAGLFALIGSTVVLYLAKHYGFRYNLGIFFALLAAGFLVGLAIDLLRFFFRHRAVR